MTFFFKLISWVILTCSVISISLPVIKVIFLKLTPNGIPLIPRFYFRSKFLKQAFDFLGFRV